MGKNATGPAPPALRRALLVVVGPFQAFFRTESSSGILLLLATIAALSWANSRFAPLYRAIFDDRLTVSFSFGSHGLSLRQGINDGLMTIFFFVVGMEIKRELAVGELRSFGRAMLPAIAALGGMLAPALIYFTLNAHGQGARGWAIPMATDIAFAVGCIALVRQRVASSLAVFLVALAIFDDLGAILVIAVFYGHGVHLLPALATLGIVASLVAMNRFGVRNPFVYLAVGVLLWIAMLRTGVHATLAGVLLGLCIPARSEGQPEELLSELEREIEGVRHESKNAENEAGVLQAIERRVEEAQSPLDRLVHGLHAPVSFCVVPLFALANSGIDLRRVETKDLLSPVALGVALGLFFGKQLGVFVFTVLAVKLRFSPPLASATAGATYGVSVLAGIGFTMSLFISQLAFPLGSPLLESAKIGILTGSTLSALVGLLALRLRRA
jgi:NhaA family Na+:H+ antiporter